MAFNSLPTKNQLHFYEKLILLDEQSGSITLDPIKNTSYLMVVDNNTTLNISNIYALYGSKLNLPINCFLQLYFIVLPIVDNKTLSFNSKICFNELSTPPSITLKQWNELHFTFLSFDSGLTWSAILSGSFGPYTNTAVSREIIIKNNIEYTYSKVYNTSTNYIYFESTVPI